MRSSDRNSHRRAIFAGVGPTIEDIGARSAVICSGVGVAAAAACV